MVRRITNTLIQAANIAACVFLGLWLLRFGLMALIANVIGG